LAGNSFQKTETFFAPVTMLKGLTSDKKDPRNPKTGYRLGGVISTMEIDSQNKRVNPVSFKYVQKGYGKIKYEHFDKDPDNYIGYPLRIYTDASGNTCLEAELVEYDPDLPDEKLNKQQRLAKSVVTFMENMERFNAKNPPIPQRAGWSIEGGAIEINGVQYATITNIAFTTQPVNTGTYARLLKSLETGHTFGGTNQEGFAAVRKESLEGEETNKRRIIMDELTYYNKCLTEDKMTPEAAKKATAEYMQKVGEALDGSIADSEKMIKKSMQATNEAALELNKAIETKSAFDAEAIEKTLRKSLKKFSEAPEDEKEEAREAYELESQKVGLGVFEELGTLAGKVNTIAKSLQVILEGQAVMQGAVVNIYKSMQMLGGKQEKLQKGQSLLYNKMANVPYEPISAEPIEHVNIAEGTKATQITKSMMANAAKELAKTDKINENELIAVCGGAPLSEELKKLVVDKVLELEKNKLI
jgi:hypothetical protein